MSRTRTALTSADKIAIAMCKSNGTPVPVIAKYFPVGERQIWRILAEFPVKYPDVSEAIDKFKKISEGISQKQEEEEPETEPGAASHEVRKDRRFAKKGRGFRLFLGGRD